jgi:hypothetical protein
MIQDKHLIGTNGNELSLILPRRYRNSLSRDTVIKCKPCKLCINSVVTLGT